MRGEGDKDEGGGGVDCDNKVSLLLFRIYQILVEIIDERERERWKKTENDGRCGRILERER